MNEFGDLTSHEFASSYIGGYVPRQWRRTEDVAAAAATTAGNCTQAAEVDWSKKGAVTPIKTQGTCGSCWAFSTTGVVEGINAINKKQLISLSDQQLIDCSGSVGNQGCNGGSMDASFTWIAQTGGLCSEAAYPYVGQDGTCKKTCTRLVTVSSYTDVPPKSDAALACAVQQQPVSIAVEGDQSAFQLYSGGVLTAQCGTELSHSALAVGFGELGGVRYFKVKNSWGASWGMAGYVLIARGEQYNAGAGQCGIYLQPSFASQ